MTNEKSIFEDIMKQPICDGYEVKHALLASIGSYALYRMYKYARFRVKSKQV